MRTHEFAEKLLNLPDQEIMILDSFNGAGYPREINLGPVDHTVTAREADECSDCEKLAGKVVTVVGYGCY